MRSSTRHIQTMARLSLSALLLLLTLTALSCSGEDTAHRENPDLDVGLDVDDVGDDAGRLQLRGPRVIEGTTLVPRPGDTVLPCPDEGCPACELDEDCEQGAACTATTCEAGECVTRTEHTRCDDGLFCNGYELCAPDDPEAAESGCVAGHPPVLADGISCTIDFCDEELDQIVHRAEDGRCESEIPCTVSLCDALEGCVTEPAEDGTLCMDDTMVCSGGECIPCIDDSQGGVDSGCGGGEPFCVDGACVQCEDSTDCPEGLGCEDGVCSGCTEHAQCNDGASCTVNLCDFATGRCEVLPLASACGGGDACAASPPFCSPRDERADATTGCVPGPSKIDLMEPITCVERSCDPTTGAISTTFDDSQCEPSGPCVTAICTVNGCQEEPLSAGTSCLYGETEMREGFCDGQGSCAVCADTVVGGIDAGCEPLNPSCFNGGCYTCLEEGPGCPRDCNGVIDGPAYEDACGQCDADPTNDCANICDDGPCSPCEADADCDDRNACTVDQCVEGFCNHDPAPLDGDSCQSSAINACVTSYSCQEGSCQRDATVVCDGQCHVGGACREGIPGCEIDVGASCDDGDPTTINDTCRPSGQCVGECTGPDGQLCPEADGNPCTVPACDGEGGCTERITPGVSCEMACGAGVCSAEGVCEPLANICNPASMQRCATFECRPDEGGCVLVEGDPVCALGDASCDSVRRMCSAGFCGDGFCDLSTEYRVGASACHEDCTFEGCTATTPGYQYNICRETLTQNRALGTWRSAQSIAYGFPEADARQTETLRTQLEDGVEWLHLVVDYCAPGQNSGPLCICHDNDTCNQASTPLTDRLLEIRDFLQNNPARIVLINLESHLERGVMRSAVEAAGLSDLLYRTTSSTTTAIEPFPAARTQLIAANQRLVIFGRDFVNRDLNLFVGDTQVYIGEENDEGRIPTGRFPSPVNVFSVEGYNDIDWSPYNCVTSTGRTPAAFYPFYAVVHNAGAGSHTFVGAACWNRQFQKHVNDCGTRLGRWPDVVFVNYYNSDPTPFDQLNIPNNFATSCPEVPPDTCRQDSDCDGGVCNFFGVCVSCLSNEDCREDQYCNGWFNACFADLPGGGLCTEPEECQSGVCSFFICQGCQEDSECQEDQFCAFDGTCTPKKGIGQGCINPRECVSDTCYFGYCTECDEQADCGEGTFCSLNPLPGQSACIAPKPNGETCAQTFECASGNCYLGFCVACDEQSDCSDPDQFCSLDPVPGASACIDRKQNGAACAQNLECASDSCYLGFCVACNSQDDCPDPDQFCSLDPVPGASACIDRKQIGEVCAQNMECASDSCYLGFCVACNEQSDCPASNQFCSLDPAPGQSRCINRKANGEVCAQNLECATGNCYLGFCVACNEQSDCPASNQFCSLDPAPGASRCINRKANGSICAQDFECASGECTAFVCGECATDAQCPASQHCDAFNNCAPDVGNGAPCLRDSACTTDLCLDGFCAQCRNDSECPASQHCDAFNNCVNDVGNGAPCLRDSACTTDLCLAGFCAQCENDSQCPASQHCDAFNNCVDDVPNGSPCLRDAACTTDLCLAGFCAQCRNDSECPSSQHCDAFNNCVNDVGNNAPCTRNEVCDTGICSAGFCAQCTNDGHCNSNQFCNVGGDCENKVPNGSFCVDSRVCQSGCCSFFTCGNC